MKTNNTEFLTNKQTELDNCTFVKTILMILVVFYHSMLFWSGNWFLGEPVQQAPVLGILSQWLNSFLIYAFTLVSGYLYAFLKYEKGKYSKFVPFVINKAKRLLIPYVFVALIWVVPISVYFFSYNVTDIFKNFILATNPGQLWFLWMLFDVFILFWPLSSFFEEHDVWGGLVVLGIYGVSIIGSNFLPNVFMIWTACSYLPLFWLGIKIRQRGTNLLKKIPMFIWFLSDIALFALVKYALNGTSVLIKLLNYGFSFALHVVGAVMAFVILQRIAERFPRWRENKIFSTFSKYSMPVYLFHQQIIYFTINWLNGVIHPCLNMGINFVVSIGLSLLISALLMKTKPTRFLIGEK